MAPGCEYPAGVRALVVGEDIQDTLKNVKTVQTLSFSLHLYRMIYTIFRFILNSNFTRVCSHALLSS